MKTPEGDHLSEGDQLLHLHTSVSHISESHAGDLCEIVWEIGTQPVPKPKTITGIMVSTTDLTATLGLRIHPSGTNHIPQMIK